LVLVTPDPTEKTDYSIYKRSGFRLLVDGFEELYRESQRKDFTILVIKEKEICWQSSINGPELVLSGCGLNRLMKDTSAFNLISGMWYRQRIPWKKI
ncbi:MAG: hypothetical protein N2053_11895, partial [Chitinispirillaceae bacterium]|nr:hypothetical protein [Chitinispirillaceae bacterium]